MDKKEKRDFAINLVSNMMRTQPFSIVYKIKKKPQGMKIVFEVTEAEMQTIINRANGQE